MNRPTRLDIYEINTVTWLNTLSRRFGRTITLDNIPLELIAEIRDQGFNAVWLMGVWERSPLAVEINKNDAAFMQQMSAVLNDFDLQKDLIGSAYSIKDYKVDAALGGNSGLIRFRRELNARGLKLIVDFVTNHVAPDHKWASEAPETFIGGSESDLSASPEAFYKTGGHIYALGKDPYLEPWSDVLQLNAFNPHQRKAAAETLKTIAGLADGVRCDMAMLFLNRIFAQTWGERAGAVPEAEYWSEIISSVKQSNPEMIFIAECYWDTEAELFELGFDYCYDKEFLDSLLAGDSQKLRSDLSKPAAQQQRLVRFIENHDEQRSAAAFQPGRLHLAAMMLAFGPAQLLYFEGQKEGLLIRTPVQLRRDPDQDNASNLSAYYAELFMARKTYVRSAELNVLSVSLVKKQAVGWSWQAEGKTYLALANMSGRRLRLNPQMSFAVSRADLIFSSNEAQPEYKIRHAKLCCVLGAWQGAVFEIAR